MGKGTGKTGSKHANFQYKKRCQHLTCDKRAKYLIGGKYLCRIHSR